MSAPWKQIGLAALSLVPLTAQQPAPTFDVASIRPVPPDAPPFLREVGFSSILFLPNGWLRSAFPLRPKPFAMREHTLGPGH